MDSVAAGQVLVSERQRRGVGDALVATRRATAGDAEGRAVELVAADLQTARLHLSELLGEEVSDEMLDSLFAQFCIGK